MKSCLLILSLLLFAGCVISVGQTKAGPSPQQIKPTPTENPLAKALQEGNQAVTAGRYDDAIAAYDRGIALDPSQYVLFLNKAAALRLRGTQTYNQSLGPNRDQKTKDAIRRDWLAAVESAGKAMNLVEASSSSTPPADLYQARLVTLQEKALDLSLLGRIDEARLPEAAGAYHAAAELAKDPVKKNQLRNNEAWILFQALDFGKALSVYKNVLETEPENLDALYGATMAAVSSEDWKSCNAYGARFLKVAPAADRRRAEIKETLDAIPK